MKKYLVVCAALLALPCFPLLSQEADEPGPGVEFTIIPRLDLSYEEGGLALGNSSVYSLLEGNVTDNLSYSMCNHWASFVLSNGTIAVETAWNTLVDWAYLSYDMGSFRFDLGRFGLFSEGMEGDQYDWDVHPILASSLWNNFDFYQQGAAVAWHNDDAGTEIALQMVTSPYGDPFTSGLYSFGAQWKGDYDFVFPIWSASLINTGNGYFPLVSLGQTFSFDDVWTYSFDWSNAVCDPQFFLLRGSCAYLEATCKMSEAISLTARGGIESSRDESFTNLSIGGYLHWHPVENLRIHAAGGYNSGLGGLTALAGVSYNLCLSSR